MFPASNSLLSRRGLTRPSELSPRTLDDDTLYQIAVNRIRRGDPLPIDWAVEVDRRGMILPTTRR